VDYLEGDIFVEIKWHATEVGSRRIARCPYTDDRPRYAHRDCLLSSISELSPAWTVANVTMCPKPPFSRGVDRLVGFVVGNLLVCQSTTFLVYVFATWRGDVRLEFHGTDTDTDTDTTDAPIV